MKITLGILIVFASISSFGMTCTVKGSIGHEFFEEPLSSEADHFGLVFEGYHIELSRESENSYRASIYNKTSIALTTTFSDSTKKNQLIGKSMVNGDIISLECDPQ